MTPTCLITGATGGLGTALSQTFSSAGYRTILCGRSQTSLDHLHASLADPGLATTVVADMRRPDDVERVAVAVEATTERLDVVVANAGQVVRGGFTKDPDPLETWRDVVLTNVFGTAAIARMAIPWLRATRGSLFLIGSVTGRMVVPGDLYAVTKHAVSALADSIRADPESRGVQVCLVRPGLIDTPMVGPARRHRPMLEPVVVAREILRLADPDRDAQTDEVVVRASEGRG